MPGFDNGCVYFEAGIDPRGVSPVINQMTTGTLLIGSSVSPYVVCNTLTAGAGIGITNGDGSITITSTSGGFTWTESTNATYILAAQTGYITNRAGGVTYTLPASGALGDIIKIVGKTGIATIAQNANQQIFIGNTNTTLGAGGSLSANNAGDCLSLVCITAGANTFWRTDSIVGNWTIT